MKPAKVEELPFDQMPGFLLELAQERSVESLMRHAVQFASASPGLALLRIWLIDKGDVCSSCPMRPQCPDQTRCLHSVITGGKSAANPPTDFSVFDEWLPRVPLGVEMIGKIAATGQTIRFQGAMLRDIVTPGTDFVQNERICECQGTPIVFKGEVLGVVFAFSRVSIPEVGPLWARIFADHLAGAVANARAFEEIQRLKAQLELENAYLQEEVVESKAFGELVGRSTALKKVVGQIDVVAPTDATVMILGETGVGKELVAYEIHKRSRRRDQALIRVNCASIPKELYESEFFGHVKGAFTGAIKDRAGRFEAANGGTLFLDEIAEIPIELQSKLLRALQEKQYERVGDDRTRRADVRIIAATNRDLKKEVEAGRFRQDLYYRLNVFPIQVAPLRDRREDIPLLATHFVDISVRELKCTRPRLTHAGVAKLQGYDWPGNVRELRNVIERAVILARGGALDFDLPIAISSKTPPSALHAQGEKTEPEILTDPEFRHRERENLLAALNKTDWKIYGRDGAAELLGLKPTTLLSRMKKMRLKRP